MSSEMATPSISTDRGLPHLWKNIDLNIPAMAAFYDTIDGVTDKPPLEDCHIHLSSLAYIGMGNVVLGQRFQNPETAQTIDPAAPPKTDIIIFLGSFMLYDTKHTVSEAIGHELVHYARLNTDYSQTYSEEELRLRLKLRLEKSKMFYAMQATGLTLALDIMNPTLDLKTALLGGVASTAIGQTLTWPIRKRRRQRMFDRLNTLYMESEIEKHAHEHPEPTEKLAVLGERQRAKYRPVIVLREHSGKTARRLTLAAHKHRCLEPHVRGYNAGHPEDLPTDDA